MGQRPVTLPGGKGLASRPSAPGSRRRVPLARVSIPGMAASRWFTVVAAY